MDINMSYRWLYSATHTRHGEYMAILIGLAALCTAMGSSLALMIHSVKFSGCGRRQAAQTEAGVDELLDVLVGES